MGLQAMKPKNLQMVVSNIEMSPVADGRRVVRLEINGQMENG